MCLYALVLMGTTGWAEVVNFVKNGSFEDLTGVTYVKTSYVIWGANQTPTDGVFSGTLSPNWTWYSKTAASGSGSAGYYGIGYYNNSGELGEQNLFGENQGRTQTADNRVCVAIQAFDQSNPCELSVRQDVTGLTEGKLYLLQYDYNGRTSGKTANGLVTSSYVFDASGTQSVLPKTTFNPSTSGFTHVNGVFQATSGTMTIALENNSSADRTVTFDNVAVVAAPVGKASNIVKDGSFETGTYNNVSNGYSVWGGSMVNGTPVTANPATGNFEANGAWQFYSTNVNTGGSIGYYCVSSRVGQFGANQNGKDGNVVAGVQVFQKAGTASLQQDLNLDVGNYYAVSYKFNRRADSNSAVSVSSALIGDSGTTNLQAGTSVVYTPNMRQYAGVFQAQDSSATLRITNTNLDLSTGNDSCLSLDDVRVVALPSAPIASGYTPVHALDMTTIQAKSYGDNATKVTTIPYAYDASVALSGTIFDRVGYYMELMNKSGEVQYAFVSMDAFTTDAGQIGLPTGSPTLTSVNNLVVDSNVAGLSRTVARGGSLEFARSNYQQGADGIFNYSDIGFNSDHGYGSFQIHDVTAKQTILSFSGWGSRDRTGAGFGNQPSGSPDWTFAGNMLNGTYAAANLYTFVRPSEAVLVCDALGMVQRDGAGIGQAKITGSWNAVANDTINSLRVSEDGTNWVTLDNISFDSVQKTFSGTVTLGTGWHEMQIQALDASGNILTTANTGRVGVGDIYLTAGQSNSANFGDTKFTANSDDLLMMDYATGKWTVAADPVSGANGSGGSTWVTMGNELVEANGGEVPIGIVAVGVGGTSINYWQNGAEGYNRLKTALEKLDGNVAAVLWHQGEADNNSNMSREQYLSKLEAMIEQSRIDANNEDLLWMLALVSYSNKVLDENIVGAQLDMIEQDPYTLLGPNSDALIDGFRAADGIHFNALGLQTLGELWAGQIGNIPNMIPEPATWALFLLGLLGLGVLRRRGRH